MSAESEGSLATRQSLLGRLKDWNQHTAWREFDRDYTSLIRNVARKSGLNDAEADEVAQETLIAVAKKIGEFEHAGNRGSFRAWLYQQARWRIADQFRARKRTNPSDASEKPAGGQNLGSGESDPIFERLWDAEWTEHIRDAALERVKAKVGARQFQLFDLHVLQELSVRDAAKAAGASIAAVYMAKSRVARILKAEFEKLQQHEDVNR